MTSFVHSGRVYALIGPQAISQQDLAGILSRVSGKDIAYRHLGYEEYAGLIAQEMGMPAEAARSFLSMNYTIEEGRSRRQPVPLAKQERIIRDQRAWILSACRPKLLLLLVFLACVDMIEVVEVGLASV